MTEGETDRKPARIKCRTKDFPALKNRWLNQVMADNYLPGKADKLARYVVDDCARTLRKNNGDLAYSFRGQASFATLLGVSERYIRTLFSSLVERCHIEVERGGRAHTNRVFPTLFDRNISSGQINDMSGTKSTYDRNSDDHMTGTYVPPSSFIGDLGGARQAPPSKETPTESDGNTRPYGVEIEAARDGAALRSVYLGAEIYIPEIGIGSVAKVLSRNPFVTVGYFRDEHGSLTARLIKHGPGGIERHAPYSIEKAEALPDHPDEADNDAA